MKKNQIVQIKSNMEAKKTPYKMKKRKTKARRKKYAQN